MRPPSLSWGLRNARFDVTPQLQAVRCYSEGPRKAPAASTFLDINIENIVRNRMAPTETKKKGEWRPTRPSFTKAGRNTLAGRLAQWEREKKAAEPANSGEGDNVKSSYSKSSAKPDSSREIKTIGHPEGTGSRRSDDASASKRRNDSVTSTRSKDFPDTTATRPNDATTSGTPNAEARFPRQSGGPRLQQRSKMEQRPSNPASDRISSSGEGRHDAQPDSWPTQSISLALGQANRARADAVEEHSRTASRPRLQRRSNIVAQSQRNQRSPTRFPGVKTGTITTSSAADATATLDSTLAATSERKLAEGSEYSKDIGEGEDDESVFRNPPPSGFVQLDDKALHNLSTKHVAVPPHLAHIGPKWLLEHVGGEYSRLLPPDLQSVLVDREALGPVLYAEFSLAKMRKISDKRKGRALKVIERYSGTAKQEVGIASAAV